jgi:hypothetical protein
MRCLVLCDDYWHPAPVAREGLDALHAKGEFEFDWIEDAGKWSAERMAGYPAVVFVKSNDVSAADRTEWMTPEVLRALMGGVFDHHPKQCPVTVQPKEGHPLVAGSEAFTVQDEHYHVLLDDDKADVFLITTSEHGSQPGGWARTEGAGRVCLLTPGHNVEVWLHPSYQVLLGNALRWCTQTA